MRYLSRFVPTQGCPGFLVTPEIRYNLVLSEAMAVYHILIILVLSETMPPGTNRLFRFFGGSDTPPYFGSFGGSDMTYANDLFSQMSVNSRSSSNESGKTTYSFILRPGDGSNGVTPSYFEKISCLSNGFPNPIHREKRVTQTVGHHECPGGHVFDQFLNVSRFFKKSEGEHGEIVQDVVSQDSSKLAESA
jgi:hypothetical protein